MEEVAGFFAVQYLHFSKTMNGIHIFNHTKRIGKTMKIEEEL